MQDFYEENIEQDDYDKELIEDLFDNQKIRISRKAKKDELALRFN